MNKCYVIGISDSREQWFSPKVQKIIADGSVFSGGKRHHEIMQPYLPDNSTWIDITVPLTSVFEQYERYEEIVIFASGDPLFYGFGCTVQRLCPDVSMTIYPAFNSLQLLAHRVCMPYHDMHIVSLTGRPWDKFDEALISGKTLIGCLTDKVNTPHAIYKRMVEYGYDNYDMIVGENLGNEQNEKIGPYDSRVEYHVPNCIILKKTKDIRYSNGIEDNMFHLLNGRSKMITKMPIRLCTLAALELNNKQTLWDIGFCTGSISIEAKLMYPHLKINAFEIRTECEEIIKLNTRKFHTPGIQTFIGDFSEQDINSLEAPDAVFIGGYGGKMKDILSKAYSVLNDGGCIVFNSVSTTSMKTFVNETTQLGMTCNKLHTLTIDDNNPITILKAVKHKNQ